MLELASGGRGRWSLTAPRSTTVATRPGRQPRSTCSRGFTGATCPRCSGRVSSESMAMGSTPLQERSTLPPAGRLFPTADPSELGRAAMRRRMAVFHPVQAGTSTPKRAQTARIRQWRGPQQAQPVGRETPCTRARRLMRSTMRTRLRTSANPRPILVAVLPTRLQTRLLPEQEATPPRVRRPRWPASPPAVTTLSQTRPSSRAMRPR